MVCAIRDTRSLLLNPSLGTMLSFIQHPFSWLMRLTPIDLSPGSTCWHIQAEPFGGPCPCRTPSKALTPACLGLAFPKATATLSSLRARNVSHLFLFPHNGAHFRYQMFNDYWVNGWMSKLSSNVLLGLTISNKKDMRGQAGFWLKNLAFSVSLVLG